MESYFYSTNGCSRQLCVRSARQIVVFLAVITILMIILTPLPVFSVGEASTYFNIFVPPNDWSSSRESMLLITAIESRQGEITLVDIIDDAADGDDDDTHLDVKLRRGETFIILIKNGKVNDDQGGKADGDYFIISSDHPVVVSIATNSDWQHDWVPAENKKMIGQNFYIYSPLTSFSDRDINTFAYYDSTDITILDITDKPLTSAGTTTIDFNNAKTIVKTRLNEGEDLIHIKKLGIDILNPGHTYYVQSTKPITVQYGALYAEFNSVRDGGGFVPSKNGYSSGELFYFYVPSIPGYPFEREVRIVSFDDNTVVQLYGWDNGWQLNEQWSLNAYEHADKIEAPALCKVVCTSGKKICVFEANWLETGASGTSDIASFLSSEHGFGAGKKFVCYLPPPGSESNSVDPFTGTYFDNRYSHLYIFGHEDKTHIDVFDTETGGKILDFDFDIKKDEYVDAKISLEEYYSIYNGDGDPNTGPERPYMTIESNNLVAVMVSDWNDNWMTYATSVLIPTPAIELGAYGREFKIYVPVLFTITSSNIGNNTLSDCQTLFTLPDGMEYISHTTPGGVKKPEISNSGTPDPSTGETTLSWSYAAFAPEAEHTFTVTAQFISSYSDGTPLLNDEMVTAVALCNGSYLDDFYETQSALSIKVVNPKGTRVILFEASMVQEDVKLIWTTEFEHNNKGFNLSRSTTVDGKYKKINKELIPSQGDSDKPQNYSFVDDAVKLGRTYYYKLENIDTEGISNFTGPISITTPEAVPPEAPQNLAVSPGTTVNHAVLGWTANTDPGLSGYNIYRSPSGSLRFEKINSEVVTDTTFDDLKLEVNNDYYYQIKAVGRGGMESDASNQVMASGINLLIPYEDLVADSWNDWDLNDFILSAQFLECYNSEDQFTKVGMYFEAMARGAAFDHEVYLNFIFSGGITGEIIVFDSTGSALDTTGLSGQNGLDILIFESSHEALPSVGQYTHVNTRKDAPLVAGYSATAILNLTNPAQNERKTDEALTQHLNEHIYSFYDFRLFIKDNKRTVYYGSRLNPTSEDIVTNERFPDSPLIGFSLKLSQKVPTSWKWPIEYAPLWEAFDEFANFIKSGETENQTWYNNPNLEKVYEKGRTFLPDDINPNPFDFTSEQAEESAYFSGWPYYFDYPVTSSPAVADLDYDGTMEIIVGGYINSTIIFDANGAVIAELQPEIVGDAQIESMASPTIADVDGNGTQEIIRGYDDYKVYVWQKNGTQLTGWPQTTGGRVKSSAAVADLDNDGFNEIIVYAGDTKLYVWDYSGELKEGWPQSTSGKADQGGHIVLAASPGTGDLDRDGFQEIAVATNDGKVYLFHHDGTKVAGWPQEVSHAIYSSTLLADINGDSTLEVIAAALNGEVHIWQSDGEVLPGWPQRMFMGTYSSPAVGNLDNDDRLEIVVGSDDGRVYAWHADGSKMERWPVLTQSAVKSSPALADINSDGKLDVVIGSNDGKVYAFNADATYLPDWPKNSPQSWVFSSPAIADLDGDADLEVLVGSHDRGVHIWDEPGKCQPNAIIWGMFRSTANHSGTPQPDTVTSGVNDIQKQPVVFRLYQNYPNPFNPSTYIQYSIPDAGLVKLEVFNMQGQKVRTLVNGFQTQGEHLTFWHGLNDKAIPVASGVYFCKLTTKSVQKQIKLLIIK